jgi:hypothetical membrane protein
MAYNKTQISGSLLFIGSIQFILSLILSEVLYPDYNASSQTISSLGVGPSAVIFNSSILLLGTMGLIGVYVYYQVYKLNLFSILLGLAYIGAIGVGIFTEAPSTFSFHVIFSFMAYVFGGISAIASYKLQKQPMSTFSLILGTLSLSAIIVLGSGNYLGLGLGGIERMVAYPLLLWLVGFGSQLITKSER